jgi:hypothetical protein
VRGRNSDNALILEKLGWEPTIKLADGLKVTYEWIKGQLAEVRAPASCCFNVSLTMDCAPRNLIASSEARTQCCTCVIQRHLQLPGSQTDWDMALFHWHPL